MHPFFNHLFQKVQPRKLAAALFVLLAAGIACYLQHPFFALFIVVFFIALLFIKIPTYALLIIPILTIVFFDTNSFDSFSNIKTFDLQVFENSTQVFEELFTPNSGQKVVLDRKVLWMLSTLQNYDLKDYGISEGLQNDLELSQRIVESAWPVKLENESQTIFTLVEEVNLYPECRVIDQQMELAVVQCP